jgi:hypothetical protein
MLEHNGGRSAALAMALLAASAVVMPARGVEGGAPHEIEVKATAKHVAQRDGAGWSLRGPGVDGQAVAPVSAGEWVLKDTAGRILLRARIGAGGEVLVASADGRERLTARPDGDGYRLFAPGGALEARVKVKPDKFNVYDAAGVRVRHGKAKEDGFSVKNASGEREAKIRGPRSLREASFFALGLDFGEAALLWRALDR